MTRSWRSTESACACWAFLTTSQSLLFVQIGAKNTAEINNYFLASPRSSRYSKRMEFKHLPDTVSFFPTAVHPHLIGRRVCGCDLDEATVIQHRLILGSSFEDCVIKGKTFENCVLIRAKFLDCSFEMIPGFGPFRECFKNGCEVMRCTVQGGGLDIFTSSADHFPLVHADLDQLSVILERGIPNQPLEIRANPRWIETKGNAWRDTFFTGPLTINKVPVILDKNVDSPMIQFLKSEK